jgi:hypothetical protein
MGLTAVIAGAMTMSSLSEGDAETPSTEPRSFAGEGFLAVFALTASIAISVIAG